VSVAWEVRRFVELASTQTWLVDQARRGAPHALVAIAEVQHAGRGRMDRRFEADPGAAVLLSVLVRPAVLVGEAPVEEQVALAGALAPALSLAALGACRDVLGRKAAGDLGLAWPNDLAAPAGKLGGVLAEAGGLGRQDAWVVAGVGVNVRPSSSWGPDVRARATSLVELGWPAEEADPGLVEARVLDHLGRLLAATASAKGRARLADLARSYSSTLGARVGVRHFDGTVTEGVAVGLDDSFRLVVEVEDGCRMALAEGDVERLEPLGLRGSSGFVDDC